FGSAFEVYSSTLYANYPDKHTLNVDLFPGCPYSTYRACSQCSTTLEHQIKLHKEWRNGLVSLSPSSSLSSTTSLAITSSSSMHSSMASSSSSSTSLQGSLSSSSSSSSFSTVPGIILSISSVNKPPATELE